MAIEIPARPTGEQRRFRKVGTRRAQSISKVVVAISWTTDGRGRIATVHAAAGSVAPAPVRLPHLERALVGQSPQGDHRTLDTLVRNSLASDCSPIDDVRSTARYRAEVLARVVCDLIGR